MFKKAIPVAMAATLILSMAGCSGHKAGGGGGGGTTSNTQTGTSSNSMKSNQNQAQTNQSQSQTNASGKVSSQGKDFADAYSRVAWVHADIIAKDWDRARDDLKHVSDKLDGLAKDKNLSADAKTEVKALQGDVRTLNASIQKKSAVAAVQAKMLINRFATDLNLAPTIAWFSGNKGGGAGAGVKNTVQHPVKSTEKGAHNVKTTTQQKTHTTEQKK